MCVRVKEDGKSERHLVRRRKGVEKVAWGKPFLPSTLFPAKAVPTSVWYSITRILSVIFYPEKAEDMTGCMPVLLFLAGHNASGAKPSTCWFTIDWKRATRLVRSLQRRIVKAVKAFGYRSRVQPLDVKSA